jgi:mRNA interferase RelE/StbE
MRDNALGGGVVAFRIEVTEQAERDLDAIRPYYRQQILDGLETHLRYGPTQESRARIKRLRLLDSPAFRLRLGDYRVFYDVDEVLGAVTVLRVLSKDATRAYLAEPEDQT